MKNIVFIAMIFSASVAFAADDFLVLELGKWDTKTNTCQSLRDFQDSPTLVEPLCKIKFGKGLSGNSARHYLDQPDHNGNCYAIHTVNCEH
jgi:hypothetical protein